jgi:multidrug efflux pump subunit AcrA (membrane-fusion protein)
MNDAREAVQGPHGVTEGGHGEAEVFDPAPHRPTKRGLTISVVVGVIAFASLLAVGIIPRVLHREAMVNAERAAAAETPKVRVAQASRSAASIGLELPGSMQALQETTVYARANGYVRAWNVDIGAHVK